MRTGAACAVGARRHNENDVIMGTGAASSASAPLPFPQIDIIGAVVIVWRVRGKTIRSVLCNIVCNNSAECDAHTYEQTNSSLDWVLFHWAHFTVLGFIFACIVCIGPVSYIRISLCYFYFR